MDGIFPYLCRWSLPSVKQQSIVLLRIVGPRAVSTELQYNWAGGTAGISGEDPVTFHTYHPLYEEHQQSTSSTYGRGVLANNCSCSDEDVRWLLRSKDRVHNTQKRRFTQFSKLMGFSSVSFFKNLFSISCSPLKLWMNLTLDFCCCCCYLEGSQQYSFLEKSLYCLDCLCGLAFKPTTSLLPQNLPLGLFAQGSIFFTTTQLPSGSFSCLPLFWAFHCFLHFK